MDVQAIRAETTLSPSQSSLCSGPIMISEISLISNEKAFFSLHFGCTKFNPRQMEIWLFTFQRIFNCKSFKAEFFFNRLFPPKQISCNCRILYPEEISEISQAHTNSSFPIYRKGHKNQAVFPESRANFGESWNHVFCFSAL